MFKENDHVVHPRYGVGTIIGTRTIDLDGEKRRYYCIEMVRKVGTVMVPVDQMEDSCIRPVHVTTNMIKRIMANPPDDLPEDKRVREANMKQRWATSEAKDIISLLRDITWYGQAHNLNASDRQMKSRAIELISHELALCADMEIDSASTSVNALLESAIDSHLASLEQPAS